MLTVVTPALSRSLTTLINLRGELGSGNADPDPILTRVIAAASGAVARHCRREFARETVREVIDLPESGPAILARYPATITAISRDGAALVASDWLASPDSGLIYPIWGTTHVERWGGRRLVVDYVAGYVLPSDPAYVATPEAARLPPEIEHAAILTAVAMIDARGRDPMLRSDATEGVGRQDFVANADMAAVPPQAAALLAPWRMVG